MTPLEAARQYAALGWPVVPLHTPKEDGSCDCPKGADCGKNTGKHPRTMRGLDDATTDDARVQHYWGMWPRANIGIDLARAGLVDIAPDSVEWFAEFTARGLPPTLRFASGGGNGHEHWLYARSQDCPIYRLTETGRYDVLSAGYAVMPPSVHRLGPTYTWLEPSDFGQLLAAPLQQQPAWAYAMLQDKQRPPRASGTAPTGGTPGEPPVVLSGDALERWYGRLFAISPDTGELDRSRSFWDMSVDLLAAGCNPSFIVSLLAERDVTLGWDKFADRANADERYSVIVEKALVGRPHHIHLTGGARTQTKQEPRPVPRRYTAATIAEVGGVEIEWYVAGFLAKAFVTEIDGKVKQSGKTTFSLALTRAVLFGEPFLGQTTTYAPIAYLSEQSAPGLTLNLDETGLLGREDFHIWLWSDMDGWTWPALVEEAHAWMRSVGAEILVVDTLGQISGLRGDDENKSGDAMRVMDPLLRVAADGFAVLISRHDRKSGGETGDSGRGSSAFAGAVDIILHLEPVAGAKGTARERHRSLTGLSRSSRDTPSSVLIELSEEMPYRYRLIGNAEEIKTRDMRKELLACLPTSEDAALSQKELRLVIRGDWSKAWAVLKELVRDSLVAQKGLGRAGDPFRYWQRVWVDDDD